MPLPTILDIEPIFDTLTSPEERKKFLEKLMNRTLPDNPETREIKSINEAERRMRRICYHFSLFLQTIHKQEEYEIAMTEQVRKPTVAPEEHNEAIAEEDKDDEESYGKDLGKKLKKSWSQKRKDLSYAAKEDKVTEEVKESEQPKVQEVNKFKKRKRAYGFIELWREVTAMENSPGRVNDLSKEFLSHDWKAIHGTSNFEDD